MNNAEKARLAREAREKEEQAAREAKLREKQAKKDAKSSRREDRKMDSEDRRDERAKKRKVTKYRRKYWAMFTVLFIFIVPAILAQLAGLLMFIPSLQVLRGYSDIVLLVQKIGFYASIAAVVGVIVAYIVGKSIGDNSPGTARYSEIDDHKLGYSVITILAIACAVLCCITAFNGDIATKSYFVDSDNGVVYAEKSGEYFVKKVMEGYSDVTIVASHNGKRVGSVRGTAARNNSSMVTLNFEDDGNFEIKAKAFAGCGRLTDVNFGSNSTYTLGKKAFEKCLILKNVDCGNGSVYTIKKKAFSECPSLEKFNVSSSKVTVNESDDEFMKIFDDKTNVTLYVNGGSIAYLADQVAGLVVGPKSTIEIAAYEAYNGNPIVLNVAKVVFEDGFNFNDCTLRISNAGLNWFTQVYTYHPFGDIIYLPDTITYIPDNFFGDDGKTCTVFFAGTEAQWQYVISNMGSNGNSNYTDGNVSVRCNERYGDK